MPIFSHVQQRFIYRKFIKPFFDKLIATIALVIVVPVLLILAFLVFLVFKKSPIFRQERPGFQGEVFKLLKLRTIEIRGTIEYVPWLGRFLRRTSLDELPQLLNVIKGEMSIVGPRPLLVEYLDFYNDVENQRHEVKPGITGLAQVSGRNTLDWDKRLELDVVYVREISLRLDLTILLKTVLQVFKKREVDFPNDQVVKFHEYRKRQEET